MAKPSTKDVVKPAGKPAPYDRPHTPHSVPAKLPQPPSISGAMEANKFTWQPNTRVLGDEG